MSDREYLLVVICDPCVTREAKQGNVMHVTKIPQPAHLTQAPWDPDGSSLQEEEK
jgi:hypothetical protein